MADPKSRRLIIPVAVLVGVAALASLSLFNRGGDQPKTAAADGAVQRQPLTTVRFNMSWLPQGSMAGVFVAMDKGYYADLGLKVEPMRGFGGIRTANELDQGMFEFAYADPISIALNRAKGGKTRMIGGLNMRLPAGACYVKERQTITKPADLAGLTFGAGQSSPIQTLLPVWLEANGVAPDSVSRIQLDPAIVVSSLIEGKVDAAECWLGNSMALFDKSAALAGVTVGRIAYADFGFDVYGSGFATHDDIIERDPDLVRNFLAATYRGYADAARDPAAATAVIRKYHELLDAAVTERQVRETAELMAMDGGAHGLNAEKVGRTVEFLQKSGQLGQFDAVDALFTNDFLPAEGAQ